MQDNQIIPQTALVTVDSTNTIVIDSYTISKKFQMRHAHLSEITRSLIEEYLSLESHLRILGSDISQSVLDLNIEDEVKETVLTSDRGRKIDGWNITEKGYLLLLQKISTPKLPKTKALVAVAKLEVANAFLVMQDMIKNPVEQCKHKKVNDSNFGKLSATGSGLARTEETRGYLKSDKKSKLSVLFGKRTRLRNKLGGFFDYDVYQDLALLDKEIIGVKTTGLQKELVEKELNMPLLKGGN